jgi:methylmalonyl-CoA mutase N-terminal domain/subunit
MGGALAAIEKGYQMREIEESAYAYQQAVESGEKVIVGVNAYRAEGDETVPPLQRMDDAVVRGRVARLKAFREKRDRAAAERARTDLLTAARGSANLVPPIVAAVEAGVTLGEICADLRTVFGVYHPPRA